MITVPKFKGTISQQTRAAVVQKIFENTQNMYTQQLNQLKQQRKRNIGLRGEKQEKKAKETPQILEFKKQFNKQHYLALAHQTAKQEEEKIWKESEEYKSQLYLSQLLLQNKQQKQQTQQLLSGDQKQANTSEVPQSVPNVFEAIKKETEIENVQKGKDETTLPVEVKGTQSSAQQKEQNKILPAVSQKQQSPSFNFFSTQTQINSLFNPQNKESLNLSTQPSPSNFFTTNNGPPLFSNLNANKNDSANKPNLFISSTQSNNSQNTGNLTAQPSPSNLFTKNNGPSLFSNLKSNENDSANKPNIFTTNSQSNPKGANIFGDFSNPFKQQSNTSSGILGNSGLFALTKKQQNEDLVNNSLQLQPEASKISQPSLFK